MEVYVLEAKKVQQEFSTEVYDAENVINHVLTLLCGINISAVKFDDIVVDSNKTFQYIEETGNGKQWLGLLCLIAANL